MPLPWRLIVLATVSSQLHRPEPDIVHRGPAGQQLAAGAPRRVPAIAAGRAAAVRPEIDAGDIGS